MLMGKKDDIPDEVRWTLDKDDKEKIRKLQELTGAKSPKEILRMGLKKLLDFLEESD